MDDVTRTWIQGPADEAAVAAGCYFDLAAAEHARRFMEKMLRLPPTQGERERMMRAGKKVEAQPFRVLDWQWRMVIGPLFGWMNASGFRRFRRGYLSTAKKNGKTGLAAAISLYMLIADGEPNPEVYTVAGSRDQASICYGDVSTMVKASPKIKDHLDDLESKREIRSAFGGDYAALASDAGNNEGYKPHLTIYDELHTAKGRALFDAMAYGGASRPQSLLLTITTAGDGADAEHVCREEYDKAKKILAGTETQIDYFACVFEAPPNCALDDVDALRAANPSLGETIRLDEALAAAGEAKISPSIESRFRRYRLNQWVSNESAWISDQLWAALPKDASIDAFAGQPCYAGMDLSATDDLTALALLFPPEDPDLGVFNVFVRFYCPEANLIRLEQQHRVSYTTWARDGWITKVPGTVVDYPEVRRDVMSHAARFKFEKLGIDRGFQGMETESALLEAGLPVHPVGAGWVSQSEPLKMLEKLVKAKRLAHDGSPVLKWNALNARVKVQPNGSYGLTKSRRREKIDGVAAIVCAMHCFLLGRDVQGPSVYATRGIRVF